MALTEQQKVSIIRKSGGGQVTGSIQQYPSGKTIKTETFKGGTIVTTSTPKYIPSSTSKVTSQRTYSPIIQPKSEVSVSVVPQQQVITDKITPSSSSQAPRNISQEERATATMNRVVEMSKTVNTVPKQMPSQITTTLFNTQAKPSPKGILEKSQSGTAEQTAFITTQKSSGSIIPISVKNETAATVRNQIIDINAPLREFTYGVVGSKGIVQSNKPLTQENLYLISSKGIYPKESSGQAISGQREQTEQIAKIIGVSGTKQAYPKAEEKLSQGIISFDIRDYNQPFEVTTGSLVETTTGGERLFYSTLYGGYTLGTQTVTKFENIVGSIATPIGVGTLIIGGIGGSVAPNLLKTAYTTFTVVQTGKEIQKTAYALQSESSLRTEKITSLTQPASTLVSYYAFAKTYQATVEYFPLRYGVVELPKANGKTIVNKETGVSTPETSVVWQGFSFELRGLGIGKQLIGASGGKIVIGESYLKNLDISKYDFSQLVSSDVYFQEGSSQAVRRAVLQENLKGLQDVDIYFRQKDLFAKSPYTQKAFIKETKSLSPEQIKEVLATAKMYGGKVEGSFVQRGYLKKGRVAGDIDIHFDELNTATAESVTKSLVSDLNLLAKAGKGNEVRISTERTTLIEANVGGSWIHATDIFSFEQGTLGSYSLGFQMERAPVKIEGIKAQTINEQALRKANSMTQFQVDTSGKMALQPAEHRTKDIGDYFTIQKTLLPKEIGKIEQYETAYKSQLPKELLSKMGSESEIIINVPFYSKTSNTNTFVEGFGSSVISQANQNKPIRQATETSTSFSYSPKLKSVSVGSASRIFTPSSYSVSSSSESLTSISASLSSSSSGSKSSSASRSLSNSLSISISKSMSASNSLSNSLSSSVSGSSSVSASVSSSLSKSSSSVSSGSSSIAKSSNFSSLPIGYGFNLNFNFGSGKKKPKYEKGYYALVKKGGKFVQLGYSPMPKSLAKSTLFANIGTTARASGKLRQSNQMVETKEQPFSFSMFSNKKDKFYERNIKGETIYIEKPKYRIDTRGEIRDISMKGVNIQKYNLKRFLG